ncbi:MAG TPA: hypothetical protein VMV84_01190 [Dehalococcoidales bacterium]|nr:hypothetical protein [Dehalococcoidales bacterium]
MSFQAQMKAMALQAEGVAYRPNQIYTTAVGAYTVFNVRNGPVLITALGGFETATDGAETVDITVNGIATDFAGAVAINAAVGGVFASCLNVAGTLVNALAIPLTIALFHPQGFLCGLQPAGPGLIVFTFATGVSWSGELFCVYRKLTPTAIVTL